MENNRKTAFGACFALASAWFGTHCGSGFATGAQATSFWVKYGAHAIYLPILSAIIMAIVAGITWELSRVRKAANYRQFGLLNIIKKDYNAVGYLGIPFVILPTLFIAPRKIRQAKAAMKAAEHS